MRLALGVRPKLQLVMMGVVAGVTAVTLLVVQRSIEATYGRMAEELFRTDVDLFSARRGARLAVARSRSLELARSVRLIAAFDERDPALLYRIAVGELRDVLVSGGEPPAPAPFFRFVGADGRVLPPPEGQARFREAPDDPAAEEGIGRAARGLSEAEPQQVGYLAPAVHGHRSLREVIVTRVVDPVGGRPLGALAIGFSLEDPGGAGEGRRTIRSGIWLEERVYSRAIPDALQPALADAVAQEIAGTGRLVFDLDGVPHRVFQRPLDGSSAFPPAYQVGLYSMAESLERQRELRGEVLAAGGLALALALVVSFVLVQGLSVPVRELAAAAGEVGRGNLAVTVPVRSQDEVGQLAAAFNEMTAGLALKEKYRSVLDLVADRRVATELIEAMVDGRLALGGELREASILFCDVRGFTALTESMAPSEVIELLNEHMSALTRIVHLNGGVVDKFVGDALIGLFGAPRTTGRDAWQAVRTGRQMIEERTRLNASSRHRLAIGVGIASGTVVAGCMGAADRLNYTVLGARVNLAARLCAQAGPMEILIDDATRQHLGDAVGATSLPPLRLKGFSVPVAAHRVTEIRAIPP